MAEQTLSSMRPNRQALNWLLVTAAITVLPHIARLPVWIVLVFVAGGAWRYACDNFHWYRPGRLVRGAITLGVIAIIYKQYGTLLGRDPGIALLIVLLGLKFLELKTLRDYMWSAFLFYLVILGGFLYAQTLWLGAYAIAAVIISTATLIRLNQPTGLNLKENLRLSAALLIKALPLMLIVYLLFPRLQGTLWGLPLDAHSGLTGLSDTMRPGSINRLSESSETAFRATFTNKPPPLRELYWRGLVMWETDGRGWSRGRPPALESASFTPLGEPWHYRILLEPSNKPWLLTLGLPATVPPGVQTLPGLVLQRSEPIRERYRYELTSYTRYRTGVLAPAERASALQLPEDLSPRVRALANQWRRQAERPQAIVQAALRYFREENFIYTLTPPAARGRSGR